MFLQNWTNILFVNKMEQEQQLLSKSSREGEERIERTRKTEWAIKKDQPEFCVVNVFSKLEVTGIYRPHERYVGDFQSKKYLLWDKTLSSSGKSQNFIRIV